jgi:hypothetical protein
VTYAIDTSALLDGWVRQYPPDVFPSVWAKLEELIGSGEVISTVEVLEKLKRKDDEVAAWAKQRTNMFVAHLPEVQIAVTRILREFPKLVDDRLGKSFADPFVIAVAQTRSCAVVTAERPTGAKNRPKIPDVCSHFGIRCLNLLELLRDKKVSL